MTRIPDMNSSRQDNNPYVPLRIGIIEQDKRFARPWMAALLTLLTSAISPLVAFVILVIVVIVSAGYQRGADVFADEDCWKLSATWSLVWCLIPGLISAILASQIARGRSTAREVLLFWGVISIPLLIAGITSAPPVHELIGLIVIVGALSTFQAMITIFFGRVFRGTEKIESDQAVSADPEG